MKSSLYPTLISCFCILTVLKHCYDTMGSINLVIYIYTITLPGVSELCITQILGVPQVQYLHFLAIFVVLSKNCDTVHVIVFVHLRNFNEAHIRMLETCVHAIS